MLLMLCDVTGQDCVVFDIFFIEPQLSFFSHFSGKCVALRVFYYYFTFWHHVSTLNSIQAWLVPYGGIWICHSVECQLEICKPCNGYWVSGGNIVTYMHLNWYQTGPRGKWKCEEVWFVYVYRVYRKVLLIGVAKWNRFFSEMDMKSRIHSTTHLQAHVCAHVRITLWLLPKKPV